MNKEVLQDLYQEEIYKLPQKTLVVIPAPWDELSDGSIQLLHKILAAVKLSPSSVKIRTLTKLDSDCLAPDTPSSILLFGVPSIPQLDLYQPVNFIGIPTIAADALDTLDDTNKKNLWKALKAMFAG